MAAEVSAPQEWTIDELAALVRMTVRNIRYYATLGLIPPPERRGRMAYYSDRHVARLELVRTMQEQGLTLGAIEQHLSRLDDDTPVEEVELRRALISSWAPIPPAAVQLSELEERAGRPLTDRDLDLLERLGTVTPVERGWLAGPTFEVGIGLLDLDLDPEAMEAAGDAIRRHMSELVLELRDIMRTKVLAPMRERHAVEADPAAFEAMMSQLRQLTLEAVVGNFQSAANGLVDGSILPRVNPTEAPEQTA